MRRSRRWVMRRSRRWGGALLQPYDTILLDIVERERVSVQKDPAFKIQLLADNWDTICFLNLELDIEHGIGSFYVQYDPFVLIAQYVYLHGCPPSDDDDDDDGDNDYEHSVSNSP